MIKDIVPGADGSDPEDFTVFNDKLYFKNNVVHPLYGDDELWVSDGTEEGTVLVQDIYPGKTGADVDHFCVVNNTLFFKADDSTHGSELWKLSSTNVGIADQTIPKTIPSRFRLHQNYPNPFNQGTVIRFELPEATEVSIEIFDIMGRHVTTLFKNHLEAGDHRVVFNADVLSSGVYVYKMTAGDFTEFKKMLMVK